MALKHGFYRSLHPATTSELPPSDLAYIIHFELLNPLVPWAGDFCMRQALSSSFFWGSHRSKTYRAGRNLQGFQNLGGLEP